MPFNSYRAPARPATAQPARTPPAGPCATNRDRATHLLRVSDSVPFSTGDALAVPVRRAGRTFLVAEIDAPDGGALARCGDVVARGADVDSAVDACARLINARFTASDFGPRVERALSAVRHGGHEAERQGGDREHGQTVTAVTTAAKKEGSR
jgi:hypothetical protein